jgi:hypothetical protein
MGVSSSPKIAFPSFSTAKDRPSPRIPAKVKEIHRMDGVLNFRISCEKLNEKLKISRINSENVNIADSSSLVLNSVTRSFHRMARKFRILNTIMIHAGSIYTTIFLGLDCFFHKKRVWVSLKITGSL